MICRVTMHVAFSVRVWVLLFVLQQVFWVKLMTLR
jgi:hypothetical protein